MYKIHQSHTVATLFRRYFGVDFPPFYNTDLSVVYQQIIINLSKFDDYLHTQFGQYEKQNLSMQDVIHRSYGKEAVVFIQKLI